MINQAKTELFISYKQIWLVQKIIKTIFDWLIE